MWQVHPRSRGEYALRALYRIIDKGSPPLTRGIRTKLAIREKRKGFTPAHAGNTCIDTVINLLT